MRKGLLVTAAVASTLAMATPALSVPPPSPETTPVRLASGCESTYAEMVHRCMVYSPSMGREIPVDIIPADNPGAPVVYVLDGMFTFNGENGWLRPNEYGGNLQSVSDGSVNIVAPVAPSATFFTDWQGLLNGEKAMWETFLVSELPPALSERFAADINRTGVMGMSMGGFAAANLASRHPDFFKALYALSGFYDLDDPMSRAAVELGPLREGVDARTQMWGSYLSNRKVWQENSPAFNASAFTMPTRLFAAGGGRAIDAPSHDPAAVAAAWFQGSPVEMGSANMTRAFYTKLALAGHRDNVDLVIEPLGAHEWDTWTKDVKRGGWSWLTGTLTALPASSLPVAPPAPVAEQAPAVAPAVTPAPAPETLVSDSQPERWWQPLERVWDAVGLPRIPR